jgi:hypothetical protein
VARNAPREVVEKFKREQMEFMDRLMDSGTWPFEFERIELSECEPISGLTAPTRRLPSAWALLLTLLVAPRRLAFSCGPSVVCLGHDQQSPFPTTSDVEEYRSISYIVRDANNFAVAHVYFASEKRRHTRHLMSQDEARTIAATIARLPDMIMRLQSAADDHDSEGLSTSERIARLAELAKRL